MFTVVKLLKSRWWNAAILSLPFLTIRPLSLSSLPFPFLPPVRSRPLRSS